MTFSRRGWCCASRGRRTSLAKKNVAEDRRLALTSTSRAGADRLSDQINTPCPHHKHAKSYAHKNTHTHTYTRTKKKSACTPLRASTIHPPLSSLPPHPAISAGQIKLKYSLENNRRQSAPIGAPRKKHRVSPAAHRTWNTIHKSQTSRTVFETGHVVCAARKEKKKKAPQTCRQVSLQAGRRRRRRRTGRKKSSAETKKSCERVWKVRLKWRGDRRALPPTSRGG